MKKQITVILLSALILSNATVVSYDKETYTPHGINR